ncbi:hypothetical protein ACFVZD_47730 [Streptomyces sp. NPDC058287]|uniref:hypothetical protein n=1 Tax=unclassified Streptomyces TaxID=2593676 RepID=UPI0036F11200
MTVGTLTPGDNRRVEAYVAGSAALLVKLDERIRDAANGQTGSPTRTPATSTAS